MASNKAICGQQWKWIVACESKLCDNYGAVSRERKTRTFVDVVAIVDVLRATLTNYFRPIGRITSLHRRRTFTAVTKLSANIIIVHFYRAFIRAPRQFSIAYVQSIRVCINFCQGHGRQSKQKRQSTLLLTTIEIATHLISLLTSEFVSNTEGNNNIVKGNYNITYSSKPCFVQQRIAMKQY